MRMSFRGNDVKGTVKAPPSKSHTHRALFMASFADGESVIRDPLISGDTVSTINMLRAMGSEMVLNGISVRLHGGLEPPSEPLNAGNSGTSIRFGIAAASLFGRETRLFGDASLMRRPMLPLLESLRKMGASYSVSDTINIKGPVKGGNVAVSGSISSQFASALLLIAPELDEGMCLEVCGNASEPYLRMTTDVMKTFGADVAVSDGTFITKGTGYVPAEYTVPGDASSSAYLLAAGALAGKVTVEGLTRESGGDMRIIDILSSTGSCITFSGNRITAEMGDPYPADIDISGTPDLFPIVSVLLSVANGKSTINNISGLRYKETDRVAATMELINGLGGNTEVNGDRFIIHGVRSLKGGNADSRGDHRIMMAAAIASLVSENPVVVNACECHNISYPRFIDDIRHIGIDTEVI